ncbi:MAG TPA: hypothetical protein VGI39_43240 [Polyangiaceae bacterium]|jgi:tetratricopeptide (TPR) repeat protein
MGAQTKPFLKLSEDLTFFVRAREVRLFNVVTCVEDRRVVLTQVALAEGHGFNQSPFFVLEDGHAPDEEGWDARAERMRVIHEERRAAMAGGEVALPPLPPLLHADHGRVTFARQCAQVAGTYSMAPFEGVVVVLAPARMAEPAAFEAAVRDYLASPHLRDVRFVVVDLDESSVARLLEELGEEQVLRVRCAVDRAALREEQEQQLARAASAPAGAGLYAPLGGVGPRVAPPPRVDAPPPPLPASELATVLGGAAPLAGEVGEEIRKRVFGAAHALQRGRGEEAIAHQRAAVDRCFALGLEREGCLLEVVLGAYYVRAGEPRRAREVYERAAARAERIDLTLAAQAYLGLGAVLAVEREAKDSTLAYARAGEIAESAGERLVAVEAFRLAGQVALEAHAPTLAMSMWQRGLAVAEEIPATAVAMSSAPATARALAAACERRGLRAQARSLLEQADRFERTTTDPGPSE